MPNGGTAGVAYEIPTSELTASTPKAVKEPLSSLTLRSVKIPALLTPISQYSRNSQSDNHERDIAFGYLSPLNGTEQNPNEATLST